MDIIIGWSLIVGALWVGIFVVRVIVRLPRDWYRFHELNLLMWRLCKDPAEPTQTELTTVAMVARFWSKRTYRMMKRFCRLYGDRAERVFVRGPEKWNEWRKAGTVTAPELVKEEWHELGRVAYIAVGLGRLTAEEKGRGRLALELLRQKREESTGDDSVKRQEKPNKKTKTEAAELAKREQQRCEMEAAVESGAYSWMRLERTISWLVTVSPVSAAIHTALILVVTNNIATLAQWPWTGETISLLALFWMKSAARSVGIYLEGLRRGARVGTVLLETFVVAGVRSWFWTGMIFWLIGRADEIMAAPMVDDYEQIVLAGWGGDRLASAYAWCVRNINKTSQTAKAAIELSLGLGCMACTAWWIWSIYNAWSNA